MRDYALETLADPDAVLVIDETGFPKQGKASCGVGRQYTGSAGKITNCQIGVFAAYVSRHGHALIDRALYLPKAWADDAARRAAAHVPPGIRFATKPRLAIGMIERAIAAGVSFAWVAADSICGVGGIEMALRRAGKGYVLGVNANSQFNSWGTKPDVAGTAEAVAQARDASAWQRLSAGEGTKGARLDDWARLAKGSVRRSWMEWQDEGYLELANLDTDEFNPGLSGTWTRGLLIRRNIGDRSLAYFTTWCPAGTTIETLVAVEGSRWAIEDSFETAKAELGLDHNETRSWHGWHRHVSLVMLAFAMLASIRRHANQPAPSQTPIRPSQTQRRHSSIGRSRKSAASPPAWPSEAFSPPTSSPGRSGAGRTKPSHNAHI